MQNSKSKGTGTVTCDSKCSMSCLPVRQLGAEAVQKKDTPFAHGMRVQACAQTNRLHVGAAKESAMLESLQIKMA